jgi:hypothetical protein
MNFRITSDRFDRIFAQWACFIGAFVVLLCAVRGLQEFAADPVQFLIGLLAALAVAMTSFILGIVTGPRTTT